MRIVTFISTFMNTQLKHAQRADCRLQTEQKKSIKAHKCMCIISNCKEKNDKNKNFGHKNQPGFLVVLYLHCTISIEYWVEQS